MGIPRDPKRAKTSKMDQARPSSSRLGMSDFDLAFEQLDIDPEESRRSDWIGRIGDLLRKARIHRRLTQADVAKEADLNQSYLSRLENAALATKGPTVDTLLRIADAIDCDVVFALSDRQSHRPIGIVRSDRPGSEIARREKTVDAMQDALNESIQAQYDSEEV